jgi:hypothetical protein
MMNLDFYNDEKSIELQLFSMKNCLIERQARNNLATADAATRNRQYAAPITSLSYSKKKPRPEAGVFCQF